MSTEIKVYSFTLDPSQNGAPPLLVKAFSGAGAMGIFMSRQGSTDEHDISVLDHLEMRPATEAEIAEDEVYWL